MSPITTLDGRKGGGAKGERAGKGLRALVAALVVLALGACSSPLALDDAPATGEHTTSSSNHTTSSGNVLPRGS